MGLSQNWGATNVSLNTYTTHTHVYVSNEMVLSCRMQCYKRPVYGADAQCLLILSLAAHNHCLAALGNTQALVAGLIWYILRLLLSSVKGTMALQGHQV